MTVTGERDSLHGPPALIDDKVSRFRRPFNVSSNKFITTDKKPYAMQRLRKG